MLVFGGLVALGPLLAGQFSVFACDIHGSWKEIPPLLLSSLLRRFDQSLDVAVDMPTLGKGKSRFDGMSI